MRYTRAAMLEVLTQDYVRAARARGIPQTQVIFKHALRNALIPIVTLAALELPSLFGGALFTETLFSLPGMGRLYYDAALKADYPLLMALLLIYSALIILFSLLADGVYTRLDPRIRLV
jgi:peptide/nickel transport system permease protein